MTNAEAIRCLSVHSSTNGSGLCTDKQHYEAKQMAIEALEQQPKTGHWIEKMDACECPYCHKAWDYCDNDTEDFDYCPKCGADLRGEQNG